MTTVYVAKSYIEFVLRPATPKRKTRMWGVRSTSGTALGEVRFYPRWRCFVFYPATDTLYNEGCLRDIATFCDKETARWRGSL